MKYLVRLNLILGEYEKSATHVVEAKNEQEAMKLALEGECHNECLMEPDGDSCWDGSDFVYQVSSCQVIPEGMATLFNQLNRGIVPTSQQLEESSQRRAASFYLCENLPADFFEDTFITDEDGELITNIEDCDAEELEVQRQQSGDADKCRDKFTERNAWEPFEGWESDQLWKEIDNLATHFKAVALGELFEK